MESLSKAAVFGERIAEAEKIGCVEAFSSWFTLAFTFGDADIEILHDVSTTLGFKDPPPPFAGNQAYALLY